MTDDRRIKRTKKALKNNLLTLLKEKPISKITVKELTELADINRGTFYLHYTDIFDLYCSIKNDFLEELVTTVTVTPTDTLYIYYLNLFLFLEKHIEISNILNQDNTFTDQIISILKKQYLESWMQWFSNSNQKHYEYFYCFAAEGSIGIIKHWCQDQKRESPSIMAQILAKFAESGFELLKMETNQMEKFLS